MKPGMLEQITQDQMLEQSLAIDRLLGINRHGA
jgi:hypothetical protein